MAPRPTLVTLLMVLSLAVDGLSLSINDILGFGYRRIVESEAPRVVEIVRWRQPVCLTAAPGVLPCLVGLQNPTKSLDTDSLKEDLKTLVYGDDDRRAESGSFESAEELADSSAGMEKSRSISSPRIYSPKIVRRVRLENMGTSGFLNPLPDGGRNGKYLRVASQGRRQTIYEIKVVDSPVVAKLVAETCLPDIGIPLCQDISNGSEKPDDPDFSLQYRKPIDDSKKPVVVVAKPPISVPVVSGGAIEFWGTNGNAGQISQGISGLLNKPSVVQTDEKPAVEEVIVVQPTASPGIFAGINGLFPLGGGNIFDIFNRPSGAVDKPPGIAGWNPFPLPLPSVLQIPAIPSLDQILYRPENDISGNPGLLGILTGGDKIPPGAGPATEKPGIFGGLFASPSIPADFDGQGSSPAPPSLFEGIGNIFRPTNRPLVIERPNEPSIIVEKPVYVVERPALLGLFDIFQTGFQSPQLSGAAEKPEVIKDPIYIFQKPVTSAPLFGSGLLPNWNIFNQKPSTVSTTAAPEVEVEPELVAGEILIPVKPAVIVEGVIATSTSEPTAPCIDIRLPEISENPVSESSLENSDSTAFSAAGVSVNESEGSSSAFAVALATSGNHKPSLKSASTSTEKDLESNGDPENLLNKIADDQFDIRDETVDEELKIDED